MIKDLSRRELFAAVGGLVLSPNLLKPLAGKEIESVEDTINKVISANPIKLAIKYTVLREQDPTYLFSYGPGPSPCSPESMWFGQKIYKLDALKQMCMEVFNKTGKIPQDNYIIHYKERKHTGVLCSFSAIHWLGHFKIIGYGVCYAQIGEKS